MAPDAPSCHAEAGAGSTEQGEDDSIEALLPKIPLGRLGEPGDIARAVAFLIESPFLSGVLLPVDGAQRLR